MANGAKHSDAISRYKGLSFHKNKNRSKRWEARITIRGTQWHLGCFRSEREAAQAYDCAAVVRFGQFARLNFPPAEETP